MKHFLKHTILPFLRNSALKMVFLISILLISNVLFSQNANQARVTQIRQQMAKIRQSTNWDNPAEAKAANEQIKVLMKQLTEANAAAQGNRGAPRGQNQAGSESDNSDAGKMNELQAEMAKQKIDVYTQIWEAGSAGKSAPVLLAKPLREEIVREFKDDESPKASSPDYLNDKDLLIIDMSLPHAQLLIDQMENYKSIKTLVVTGGKNGAMVNLNDILTKAAGYPLESLYIINFKGFVKTIPQKINNFGQLKLLALFNNQIEKLPPAVGMLSSLKILYLDINPLQTIEPVINSLTQLDTLGVAKTKISAEEIKRIGQLHANCKILEQ